MKRRNALFGLCAVLSGCGGGSPDPEPAPKQAPESIEPTPPAIVQAPTPAAPPAVSQPPAPDPGPATDTATEPTPLQNPAAPLGIAVWGDSLSNYAPQLQALYPDRVVFNGSVGGQTSTQIKDRQIADTKTKGWINVFCYGRNNATDKATVLADLAASVASLDAGNDKFIVLSIRNGDYGDWEAVGGGGYKILTDLNDALAAAHANNYFDIRAFLVSKYDPTNAQDLKDFARDIPPSTLRGDALHLNAAGAQAQAERLKQYIDAKGW